MSDPQASSAASVTADSDGGIRYSWTQAVCEPCWAVSQPGREPARMNLAPEETCSYCGHRTQAGIYVRQDPATVRYPQVRHD